MGDITLLSDLLPRTAARIPGAIAVESPRGSRRLTYRELQESARRGAVALRVLGVPPGGRVVIAIDGSPEWAVAFWSVIQAGFVAVAVPAAIPADLLRLVACHSEARVCVLDESSPLHTARLPPILRVTPHDLIERGVSSSGSWGPTPGALESGARASPSDTAVLVFTSGSTARPRAVELSHANILANLHALESERLAATDETLLSVLPPAHVFELVVGQIAPIALGARIVYAGAVLPNRILDAMQEGVTRALLVPSLLDAIGREIVGDLVDTGDLPPVYRHGSTAAITTFVRTLTPERLDALRQSVRARIGHSLRTLAVGGAAMTPATSELMTAFGIAVDVGYGLTEAGPLVSMGLTTECPPGSVGRPLPGIEVRIDERGEILVRGGGVMRGYFKDFAGSAIALEDGWLRTGDRGVLDASGFLYVTGRLKEAMVTYSGETIYPEEIEPYYASPLFIEHCVVPVTGSDGNDLPTLVVVPAPSATDSDVADAFARLRKAAPARYRVTSHIRVDTALPRTAVGKLRRRALADELTSTPTMPTSGPGAV
jgi:long-chain acyl-CoA synthetase